MNAPPIIVRGMWGLGDNIFQRACVRELAKRCTVYLETPWPQLYADLPVKFIQGHRALRTQLKNIGTVRADTWAMTPFGVPAIRVGYGTVELARGSILDEMRRLFGIGAAKLTFDLPPLGPSPVRSRKPIAFVRPVTIRREWRNESRNPDPLYVYQAAEFLRRGYHVVTVADVQEGEEWLVHPVPIADQSFLAGELSMLQMLALARESSLIVGGVGWIVPAGIALGVPTFVIVGGNGAHNAPEKLLDENMNLKNIVFAMPERFCRCTDKLHRCDKKIADLLPKLVNFLRVLSSSGRRRSSTNSRAVA